MLTPGSFVTLSGFITKASLLRMKSAERLEREFGFQPGRLAEGWSLLFLQQKPGPNDFEFAGYTQMSGGIPMGHLPSPPDPRTIEQRLRDEGDDLDGRKRHVIETVFVIHGPDRLAKIVPVRSGDVYPPGLGQPQWKLVTPLRFKVAAAIAGDDVYSGNYI